MKKTKQMVLKFWLENGKMTKKVYRVGGRRFSSSVVPSSFKKSYVKVSYGKKECNFGCICEFYNDGEYANKVDLLKAIRDFLEEE